MTDHLVSLGTLGSRYRTRAHVANASYAVRADARGLGLCCQMGEALLYHSLA